MLLFSEGLMKNRLTSHDLVKLLCENPAKIFNIYPQKGTIAVGSDADLVVINPNKKSQIEAQKQSSRVDYSLYQGWELQGKIEQVFFRGELVIDNGTSKTSIPKGQYLFTI